MELTEAKADLVHKLDSEGFGYWLTDYYDDEAREVVGPELAEVLDRARSAYLEAEQALRDAGYLN